MGQDKDKEKTAQQNTWHWYSSFISLTTLDESLPMDRTRLVFFDEKSNQMVDVLTLNSNEEKRYDQIEERLQRLSKERRLFYYEPGERLPRRLLTGEDGLVTKTEPVDREPQVKPQPKKMKLWKRALNTMTFGRLFKQEKKDYEDAVEAYKASVKEHALWEQEVQKGIPACFDRGEEAVRDESLRRERELDKAKEKEPEKEDLTKSGIVNADGDFVTREEIAAKIEKESLKKGGIFVEGEFVQKGQLGTGAEDLTKSVIIEDPVPQPKENSEIKEEKEPEKEDLTKSGIVNDDGDFVTGEEIAAKNEKESLKKGGIFVEGEFVQKGQLGTGEEDLTKSVIIEDPVPQPKENSEIKEEKEPEKEDLTKSGIVNDDGKFVTLEEHAAKIEKESLKKGGIFVEGEFVQKGQLGTWAEDLTKSVIIEDPVPQPKENSEIKEEKEPEKEPEKEDLTKSGIVNDDGDFVTREEIAAKIEKESLKKGGMFVEGEFVQKGQLGSGGESTEEVTEEEEFSAEEEAEFEAALAEENGEVISDRMKSVRNEDISDVDEAELDEIDFELEDTSTIDTPGKKLRDIDESFSRIAKTVDSEAEPVAVDAQQYTIPMEVALYCTVAAARSSVGTVVEDLSNVYNGTNMKPLTQAKEIWSNTPIENRADLLIHGLARLCQMAAEPIGLDREMIMSGLVIGNTLRYMQGSLRQEVISKLQGNSRDMVLGAQELGEIGYGGLLANQCLQNPKMSGQLSQAQRQEMITSALVYEAVGQEMDHRNVSRTKNGMPIPSSLQPMLGRENGLKALHSSVEQYERQSAGGSLYSMDLNTLAQTMQNRDKLKERVLPLQREKSPQNVQSAPQKNTQRTKEKNVVGISF